MNRLSRFLDAMCERGFHAALIHRPENMRYLTGYTGEGCLFISRAAKVILTDFRYVEQVSRQAPEIECVRTRMGKSEEELIGELLAHSKATRLAVETDFLCYDVFMALSNALGRRISLCPLSGLPEELRMIKDEGEIASIVRAAKIACQAFEKMLSRIRPGLTEKQVQIELNHEMLRLGSEEEAFDTIACAGENGALPHGVPGSHVLKEGELLTLDFGATIDGYRSDMTRTVGIGRISGALRDLYQTVLDAQLLALDMIHPGAICEEIDLAARKFIDKRYPGAFGHSLGHGVGLYIHEQPRLGRGDKTVLKSGHVVTIEPGIYISGLGGCRIEDMAILTSDGFLNPIDAPKQLIEL